MKTGKGAGVNSFKRGNQEKMSLWLMKGTAGDLDQWECRVWINGLIFLSYSSSLLIWRLGQTQGCFEFLQSSSPGREADRLTDQPHQQRWELVKGGRLQKPSCFYIYVGDWYFSVNRCKSSKDPPRYPTSFYSSMYLPTCTFLPSFICDFDFLKNVLFIFREEGRDRGIER